MDQKLKTGIFENQKKEKLVVVRFELNSLDFQKKLFTRYYGK